MLYITCICWILKGYYESNRYSGTYRSNSYRTKRPSIKRDTSLSKVLNTDFGKGAIGSRIGYVIKSEINQDILMQKLTLDKGIEEVITESLDPNSIRDKVISDAISKVNTEVFNDNEEKISVFKTNGGDVKKIIEGMFDTSAYLAINTFLVETLEPYMSELDREADTTHSN